MITIYHNPRCSKSREGVCFLNEINQAYQINNYIEKGLTEDELKIILNKLNYKPIDLVRTKEKLWIENFKDKNLTDIEIIKVMVENPKLIERPIVINNDKAVVARPSVKINEIL